MKLTNPHGKKKIIVKTNEVLEVLLEDLETTKLSQSEFPLDKGTKGDLSLHKVSRDFHLTVELLGKNAQCLIEGRIHSQNSDQKEWNITQIFRGKNQFGKINLHGVAEENSNLTLNASGILESKSTQATALISEKILLFEKAKGQLLPVLTVKTDDVKKAKHSASITPVKLANLLFLSSRGIPPKEAEDILKKGFLK